MKRSVMLFFCAFLFAGTSAQDTLRKSTIEVIKIWDQAPHNAFTDLIRFNGAFYCCFREGLSHMPKPGSDGKVRIIKSVNGEKWESVALLEKDSFDLRDPKISVTPEGRIMSIIGGSVYDQVERTRLLGMYPHVSFSDVSGSNFSKPQVVVVDTAIHSAQNWIWRVVWHKNTGYGIDYHDRNLDLVKTKDGKYFEKVSTLNMDGSPNESAIRFDKNDQIFVLLRRDAGDKFGVLAQSRPPYTEWTYKKLTIRLGGPDFVFYKDKMIIGSRFFESDGQSMAIIVTDIEGNIKKTIKLPSSGDCSYPGMIMYDGKLWVSYYSKHEGKASIFLARISLSEF